MKLDSPNNGSLVFVISSGLFLIVLSGCGNPLNRFTKQYKCHLEGKADPRTAYEFVERSFEHVRLDQTDCALSACNEAIRLDSRYASGYACRGAMLGHKGEYLNGLEDLNYAIRLQPANGDYYHTRAQINARLGNMDQAISDATKATELISSEFGRSVAFAFRGSLYRKQSKLSEAIKDYDEAVQLAPNFAYHIGTRGDIRVELKDYDRAIADYTEAIRLDPRNQYFLRDRAGAYKAIGKYDLASQDEAAANLLNDGAVAATPSP